MSKEIDTIKTEYLRKILSASLCNRNYSTVIINASFCLDHIKDILEKLKEEFRIKNLIINDFNYKKVKEFFKYYHGGKDIENLLPKFPVPHPNSNIKVIYFNNITDSSRKYYSEYAKRYRNELKKYNKDFFEIVNNLSEEDKTITCCPNKEWAKELLGCEDKLDELWRIVNEVVLNTKDEKIDTKERLERKDILNSMQIRKISFYTDLGTDVRMSLNTHSLWGCEPTVSNKKPYHFNYPSYEIFTSPDCYSAEGTIVLSKMRKFYHDIMVTDAEFYFKKGRLVDCESNNDEFSNILLTKSNRLNRIGEIALVSQDSPLARNRDFYNSVLLDENIGCHFALGNCIEECCNIDKEKVNEKGLRYYHYNTSQFHKDFVFGDDSITVEAELKGKKKILLMENGIWKI